MLYIIEVVSVSRIVKKVIRTTDYDFALSVFDARKKMKVREVRMVKIDEGRRYVLKYLDRTRNR